MAVHFLSTPGEVMTMLKIRIASDDFYYVYGLTTLLNEVSTGVQNTHLSFSLSGTCLNMDEENIQFRDTMVSITIRHNADRVSTGRDAYDKNKIIIHIPFICRQNNLAELTGKLKKILLIASMDYNAFMKRESYKSLGLKKYLQLSLTESKVMLLIGKGYDISNISRLLNRSEKTINTHCRNATRKLGMVNRVDFYRYANFIAHCGHKERNTLCI